MIRRILVLPVLLLVSPALSQSPWTTPVALPTGQGDARNPAFGTKAEDSPVIAGQEWLAWSRAESPPGARSICALLTLPGGTGWIGEPMVVFRDSASNDHPTIALRQQPFFDAGTWCAWERTDPGGGSTINLSSYRDSAWSTPILIDRGGGDDHRPSLAVSNEGFAVTWIRRGRVVLSFRRDSVWTLPEDVSAPDDTLCVFARPYATTYPVRWCVIWETQKPDGTHGIRAGIRTPTGWVIDTVGWGGDNRNPAWVQRSFLGTVQAVWEARSDGRWEIRGRVGETTSSGIAWGDAEVLSAPGAGRDDHEPALMLAPIPVVEARPQVFRLASAWRSVSGSSDSIALATWNGPPSYVTPAPGALDRHPVLSSGVWGPWDLRVWAVWESDAGGTGRLWASSTDINLDVAEGSPLPEVVRLSPAWPNPFNGTTRCVVELAVRSFVRLDAADMLGRQAGLILEGELEAGRHTAVWDAGGVPSGAYLLRLRTGGRVRTTGVVVLR